MKKTKDPPLNTTEAISNVFTTTVEEFKEFYLTKEMQLTEEDPFHREKYEELVVQNLRREPHSSVTVCRFRKLISCCYVIAIPQAGIPAPALTVMQCHFRKLKSCCYVIAIPQAGIPAPALTIMQGFEAKKRKLRAFPSQYLHTTSHIHYPTANRTQVRRVGS